MQLSGFTTGDLLHRGADATVWSATERRTGRRVAIKRARTDETTLREAQRLMVAQGEGVVELIGVVQTDEGAAIMLERAGESLKQRLLERGPLPPREALTIALGVARTLTRLHDAGVIHRDIKPSNLLAAEDERGWLLMDFGVAAQLEKDADTVESRALVGSAPYVPPEQTGRVARGVDARADLYSLGVTLYELLCGEPPFTGESLMELVSAHLTREPPPLGERVPGLPEVVAAIVHKLLRKQPEDRYQSAVGLAEDLERCLEALARGDELASFELARSDRVPLRIPDELFGRARELDATLEHARAAWDGHGVVINLVAKPGYGRTRLLREVFAALARDGALCLAAASDDDARTPLAGFTRALRELARQLLTRDEDELGRWRERLNEALGGLGAVILELAPELRALLGEQPPLEELPPAKARTRLEQAMVRLLSGLGAPGRPLALYYADFERSDEAGQALLRRLVGHTAREHVALIIGCESPPRLDEAPVEPRVVTLGPLPREGIVELLAAALERPDDEGDEGDDDDDARAPVNELAALVERETGGRPAHINTLLRHLARLGAIWRRDGAWRWSIDAIRNAPAPDSMAELVVERAKSCSAPARALLEAAACLGAPFTARDVAAVLNVPEDTSTTRLWELLGAGLVIAAVDDATTGFEFPHPSLPRAVLAELEPARARALHGAVVLRLHETLDEEARRERLFELTAHLDALGEIEDARTRTIALELYARAGAVALAATAYEAAHAALERALELLPADAERTRRPLWRRLHLDAARTAYASDDFPRGERIVERLLARELAPRELAELVRARFEAYTVQGLHERSLELGAQATARLGATVSIKVNTPRLLWAVMKSKRAIDRRTDAELRALPIHEDEVEDAVGEIITAMGTAGYHLDPRLMMYHGERALQRALSRGANVNTAGAFRTHSISSLTILGDHARATRMMRIADHWAERYPDAEADLRARGTELLMLKPWDTDPRELVGEFQELARQSVELGDTTYANYFLNMHLDAMTWAGRPLPELVAAHERALETCDSWGEREFRPVFAAATALMRAAAEDAMTQDHLDALLRVKVPSNRYTTLTRCAFVAIACDRLDLATPFLLELTPGITQHVPGMYYAVWGAALTALATALSAHDARPARRRALLRSARAYRRTTAKFVARYPGRYEHVGNLVDAELAALADDAGAALGRYELARAHAERCDMTMLRALACQREMQQLAREGLRERAESMREPTIELLERWGARARADALIAARPRRRRRSYEEATAGSSRGDTASSRASVSSSAGSASSRASATGSARSRASLSVNESLDLHTVLSASQAISEELSIDGVLSRVLAAVAENTGARRALLALTRDGELYVEARLNDGEYRRVGAPLRALEDVPHALLRLASRQRARVVIDDASLEDAIADDPYVARGECRSLLVAPLVRKGDVVGLLLLENASMSGAFTEDRIKVVEILGTQAAISLDNAQLYDELEARVARRTAELAERNAAMRLVLDNVRQGFLTLDPDAQISPERSAIISRWFGDACQGDFREFLASRSAVLAEWFELGWDSLRDGFLPLEVSVAQLPQRLELDARVFQIEWHPIVEDDDPEQLLGMLVVITDITVDLAKAEGDRKSLEHVKIFRRMSRDPVGFAEFVEEADRLVDQIRREHDAPPDEQLAWRKRWLHTLKGNCSIFGVNSVASTCAEIEHELAETRAALQPEQIARLRQRWDEVLEFVRSVGGDRPRDIRIPRRELNALIERARGVAPELAEALARWTLEPVADRFARLAEQAKALALRLGKPELVVEIDAGELRLDPERHRELWSNMVHAVRNAIDHGVEDPEIRRARGKPPTGQLRLSATRTPDHLVIEIADDGGGVDWSALRETARVAGLPHETHAELVAARCTDGITSRAIVTDISGRGVGMSALLQAVRSLGGAIEVESELARGSTIRVLLPV